MAYYIFVFIYTYNGILFSHKKKTLSFIIAWMDLENIMFK